MTFTQPHQTVSPLRVVPPTAAPLPSPQTPVPVPEREAVAPTTVPAPHCQKWLIGSVLLGASALSLIPLPHTITGNVELKSTPHARQTVTLPQAGTLQTLYVQPHQMVQAGQPLALIASDDLDRQIDEASINTEQSWLSAQSAQQQLRPLQARLAAARVDVATSQQQADQLQQELTQATQGVVPPQVSELESEIAGLQSEQAGIQANLVQLEQRLRRYAPAVQSGAIAQDQWTDLQQQQAILVSQLQAKGAQIQAKQAQIKVVSKTLHDELIQRQNQVERLTAQRDATATEVSAMSAELQNRLQIVTQRQAELQRRQGARQQLVVQATLAGTIVTEDLDLLTGQKLKEGEKLLEIVNLDQLTASVQISQEDAALVKPGATVKFRPREGEFREYTATVQSITPVVTSDATQQTHCVAVKLVLQNSDHRLQPGAVGYAHIDTASLSIGQRVQRELLKLLQPGRFV